MARLPAAVSAGLLLVSACVRSVPAPDVTPPPVEPARLIEQIQDWEDRRSLGGGELVRLATSAPDGVVRVRALRALARIQDVETLEAVLVGLTAPRNAVREEAAFAAGELAQSWEPLPEAARTALTEALVRAEASEAYARVRNTLLESLGKLATPGAVEVLTARLSPANGPWSASAATALGVAARKAGPEAVANVPLETIRALLDPRLRSEVNVAGAYLLAASKRLDGVDALRSCVANPITDVMAPCVKSLGDLGSPRDALALNRMLGHATSRASAEVARALAKLAAKCEAGPPCEPLLALEGQVYRAKQVAEGKAAQGHALLAVAQQGLPLQGRPVLSRMRSALAEADRAAVSDEARADLAWLDCRFAAAMDRQQGPLEQVRQCGYGRVPEARWLALGLHEVAQFKGPPTGAAFAVPYLDHVSAIVRGAALDALSERPVPEAMAPIRALIGGGDAVVAGLAAAAAGKLKDAEALTAVQALADRVPKEPDLAEAVAGALVALQGKAAEPRLREWLAHPHANVRRVAAESLTSLTGARVRSARVELPPETYRPPAAPSGTTLTLRTRKGDITVLLDPEAPLTGGNLVALAKQGYFRGITFHRVVPDFVAQGGDPRGDGEGGPGYSIRCEMTRRTYARGTVGMALSGKDTGGSQFFFTHSPQPHLDGRYTAFGEVVRGMDVVDALLEGTIIDDVIVRTRAP
ncbi:MULTISPECIES: peptidylprolyl isomerase [unclassified Corallococcus]|uniref:peptidylprolyl isomerase n=1 Tax=unclassified Corallococcus TaxID=2685029 RepID=UPI001A8EFA04|nr:MULTISPECIES: peptidylprolyl isomerase [unclassified Corallococcus]MBN9684477.1 peptidylprolyl isomerase [Corallococcus sp. NCSPR001]WAS84046.1 peptidylprolyl isomerase [Corallococcus sp. NCRR]